jgi:hypothetical protein
LLSQSLQDAVYKLARLKPSVITTPLRQLLDGIVTFTINDRPQLPEAAYVTTDGYILPTIELIKTALPSVLSCQLVNWIKSALLFQKIQIFAG